MSMEKETNSTPDIYEILGIDPQKGIKDEPTVSPTPDNELKSEYDDPNAPSGSIFDNYSKYTDNQPHYWRWFRILTIIGIVTVILPFILYFISSFDWNFSSSRTVPQTSPKEFVTEESDTDTSEETTDIAAPNFRNQTLYFKGKINGKYPVHMLLDFPNNTGRYYYDRSGSSNCMYIDIIEVYETDGKVYIELNEMNANGEVTGVWEGYLTEDSYSGTGTYLGKEMPFDLSICELSDTDF